MDRDFLKSQVLKNFYDISRIPRCSGNEEGISNYLKDRYGKLGFEIIQDKNHNLIIKKDGNGLENKSPVVIQSHLDMVCEVAEGFDFDFDNYPIKLALKDGFLSTDELTTLGADNGIGVAMMMSILDDETAVHPPLEMVFTVEEETTFKGAYTIDQSHILGKRVINLDNSVENTIVCGSAGGILVDVFCALDSAEVEIDLSTYCLKISGMLGGHSGQDVEKGRANAVKVLTGALYRLPSDILPLSIEAGNNYNAIPRDAKFYFQADDDLIENIRNSSSEYLEIIREKYSKEDIDIKIEKSDRVFENGFSVDTLLKLLNYLMLSPIGINSMDSDLHGVVSSSSNLGKIRMENGYVVLSSEIRGSYDFEIEEIVNRICHITDTLGFGIETSGYYPPWRFNPNSKLLKTALKAYEKFGSKPEITSLHAGLEAGVLSQKLDTTEIISIGPTIKYLHSPLEMVDIESVDRIYAVLLEILKTV
ncbi:beta-Ala-His dipeptidase [Microaceticoccus formicicus]|uniref:beta-Ala-His dipeptidase n=1 Tax=Microaceticoccus formicicus TaxID=3118105 RepID=UPI003CD0237B|nr:beta-Ala-His dipeptidase [Peptoniphilaceae bacterium AMB_02]